MNDYKHEEPDWDYLTKQLIKIKPEYAVKTDNVNHPQHYTQGGIETIDYLQAKMTKEQFEGYLLGNILKYVSRYPHKNGVEDLQKAEWYIDKLIGVIENE